MRPGAITRRACIRACIHAGARPLRVAHGVAQRAPGGTAGLRWGRVGGALETLPAMTGGTTSIGPGTPPPRPRLSWWARWVRLRGLRPAWRWPARLFIQLPIVALALAVVLGRSPVTAWLLLPRLGSVLGVVIDADAVVVHPNGNVEMSRAAFRVRGMEGPGAVFLEVERLVLDVNWRRTVTGSASASSLVLHRPVLRISQSIGDASLNIARLGIPAGVGGGGPSGTALPRIIATGGAVELGEHTATTYTTLKRLEVEGSLLPSPQGRDQGYTIALHEIISPDKVGPFRPIDLTGTVTNDGVEIILRGVPLQDWPPESVPSRMRQRFRELALAGEISQTRFTMQRGRAIHAAIELADVSMQLPIPPEDPDSQAGPIQMSGVSGSVEFSPAGVRADVRGRIEDLPYRVTLDYRGLTADSPFECRFVSEKFQVASRPRLLPYAPRVVRERLRDFSGPTALLTTHVTVSRDAHAAPARAAEDAAAQPADAEPPLRVSGEMWIENGQAAFHKFPYPFTGMSGHVRFDAGRIEIIEVTGTSASGARLSARGEIAPLDENAGVDIRVHVEDAPVDDLLEQAMSPDRREMIEAIMSRARFRELLDAGLVVTPEDARALPPRRDALREALNQMLASGVPDDDPRLADLRRELHAVERRLAAPEFAFRGAADVDVRVRRREGPESDWTTQVDIRFERVGLLPERFPVPILGRDVVVQLDDDSMRLVSGEFTGLAGGTAALEASLPVGAAGGDDEAAGADAIPRVRIAAAGVPIDALFLNALPDTPPGPDGTPGVRAMLQALRPTGTMEIRAVIGERSPGVVGYDVHAAFRGLRAEPLAPDASSRVALADLTGTVDVSESGTGADIAGRLIRLGAPGEPARDTPPNAGAIHLAFRTSSPEGPAAAPGTLDARVTAAGLDLSCAAEDLLAPVAPGAAARWSELRERHRPAGHVDVTAQVSGRDGTPPRAIVECTNPRGLSFDALGARLGFDADAPAGSVAFEFAGDALTGMAATDLRLSAACDGQPAGRLTAHGGVRLSLPGAAPGAAQRGDAPHAEGESLRVALSDARFESGATRRLVLAAMGDEGLGPYDDWQPHGEYEADVVIAPGGGASPWRVRGALRPRSLGFTRAGERVHFHAVAGAILFDESGGEVRSVRADAAAWSIEADGHWRAQGRERVELDLALAVEAAGLAPDLVAALPQPARDLLDSLAVRAEGPVSLRDGRVRLVTDPDPLNRSVEFSGRLHAAGASLDVGVPIRDAAGDVDVVYESPVGGHPATYELEIRADALRAAGVRMTNGFARLHGGPGAGEARVSEFGADCHEGRIAGRGRLTPAGDDARGPRRFEAEVSVAGVRFAGVLGDLVPSGQASAGSSDTGTRGQLDGELTLGGIVGRPETRRGRGSFQIHGKDQDVIKLPLVLPLIEVSNLRLPRNEPLDLAMAVFALDGGRVWFEHLSVFSETIGLFGYGTMTWPDAALDLRFTSKSSRRMPLVSDLIEGVRDEILSTRVGGTLAEPDVRLESFAATRRALGLAFGVGPTEQQARLLEVQARAERELQRVRDAAERRRRAPAPPEDAAGGGSGAGRPGAPG